MIVIEFRKAGTTGEFYSGITHNCSDNGFIFESETLDLQSGIELDLKLKHPGRDETINCTGDVAWTTKQKYGLIAEVKLHNVPTEKQSLLAEIIPPHPPADSSTREEFKPAQSPLAEDRDPAQNESYSDRITKSIVSAVWKNSAEEAGSTEERYIEAVSPEVRTEKSGPASKVKNRQGRLLSVLITVLIFSASTVLAGYLIHNSSTERLKVKLSSLLMSRNAVSGVPPKDRDDEFPLNKIKEPANAQIKKAPKMTEPENTFWDTDLIAADLMPDEDSPSESPNKGPETGKTVAGERYIIHVAAWKTKEYAISINKEVVRLYPDAIMVFENNFHIVMVPNIASHEEAFSISKELEDRFDLSPLIYVQQRNIPEISKTDKTKPTPLLMSPGTQLN